MCFFYIDESRNRGSSFVIMILIDFGKHISCVHRPDQQPWPACVRRASTHN